MPCEISNDQEFKTTWFTRALAQDQLETWFQPLIDTSGQQIIGHECLMRICQEAVRDGREILEAARAQSMLSALNATALTLAVRSAGVQSRQEARREPSTSRFFINVMPGLIADTRTTFEPLVELMNRSGLAPRDFVFEAVDSDLAGDSARLRAAHEYIRRLGCGFGLDNAGAGTNCFELIRDFRPDYIKIDRSVVWNAEQPVCAATIRKLVEVGDRFGSEVVAVGVERPRMVENLWLLGVKVMQGFLFGRPSRQVARSGGTRPHGTIDSPSAPDLTNLALALDTTPASSGFHPTPLFADLN